MVLGLSKGQIGLKIGSFLFSPPRAVILSTYHHVITVLLSILGLLHPVRCWIRGRDNPELVVHLLLEVQVP